MPAPVADSIIIGAFNPVEGKVVSVPSHQAVNEKERHDLDDEALRKEGLVDTEISAVPAFDYDDPDKDNGSEDVIIITGEDAATHLLPLRDDFEPALTFRSIFLATALSGFQATMYQIYQVS